MARGENMVIMLGNLVKDPELRTSKADKDVCTFRLAIPKPIGDKQDSAVFINCAAFGHLAKIIATYATKGTSCYARGWLNVRSFERKDGKREWSTEVVVNEFTLLGKSKGEKDVETVQQPAGEEDIPF